MLFFIFFFREHNILESPLEALLKKLIPKIGTIAAILYHVHL